MADPLDALRLTLMQDVLPVGMAVLDRARKGGPREVMAAFDGSAADPLGQLRQEGEPAASQVRESLDRLSPGLGNPVMKVDVRDVPVDESVDAVIGSLADDPADEEELLLALERINRRLDALERQLVSQP